MRIVFAAAAALLLAACAATPPATPEAPSPLAVALAAPDRPAADTERDAGRNPGAILAAADIKPGQRVVDLGAGGGYLSRLVASLVGPEGRVIAQNPPLWLEQWGQWITPGMTQLLADRSNVEQAAVPFDQLGFADNSLDAALSALIYHDVAYQPFDRAKMNAQIFAALKPGGLYVVEDHFAADGAGVSVGESLHRIEASVVRSEVEAAGFVLESQSEAQRHPDDDRSKSVFDESIRGRTDRFVYVFRKPRG